MLIQSVFMPLLTLFQDGISQVFTFSKIHNLHRLAQYPRKTKIAEQCIFVSWNEKFLSSFNLLNK